MPQRSVPPLTVPSVRHRRGAASLWSLAALIGTSGLLTQCARDIDFGHTDPCPYTRMVNDVDDEANLSEGRACFDQTVAEGTPITWDLEVFTVEGDPIFYRVEWDAEVFSIYFDARQDEFGGGVGTNKCVELATGDFPACP